MGIIHHYSLIKKESINWLDYVDFTQYAGIADMNTSECRIVSGGLEMIRTKKRGLTFNWNNAKMTSGNGGWGNNGGNARLRADGNWNMGNGDNINSPHTFLISGYNYANSVGTGHFVTDRNAAFGYYWLHSTLAYRVIGTVNDISSIANIPFTYHPRTTSGDRWYVFRYDGDKYYINDSLGNNLSSSQALRLFQFNNLGSDPGGYQQYLRYKKVFWSLEFIDDLNKILQYV